MKKRVMIVGGSKWQLDIIKSVKAHGFETIVVDISGQAPGKAVADIFYQADSNDREALLAIARKHDIAFAIAEQTDRVVPIVAYINEQLNLPGIRPDVAARFTDKYLMRNALNGTGLAMPAYFLVSSAEEAVEAGHKTGYPLILKPRSSQSSLGVFKIMDKGELMRKFAESLQFSRDGSLLIEQYIPGTEITVEGFCIGRKCYPLAISEKEHYPQNDCVSRKLMYPPAYGAAKMQAIKAYITRVVETLGLETGIFHAELKIDGDRIFLIEVAARGGGHKIASVIVPQVSGVDMYDLLIRSLDGQSIAIDGIGNGAAVLGFFDFEPGVVSKVTGAERIKADKRIYELHFNFNEGDEIRKAQDDITRAGYYIALCKDRKELEELDRLILSTVGVEYEKTAVSS